MFGVGCQVLVYCVGSLFTCLRLSMECGSSLPLSSKLASRAVWADICTDSTLGDSKRRQAAALHTLRHT